MSTAGDGELTKGTKPLHPDKSSSSAICRDWQLDTPEDDDDDDEDDDDPVAQKRVCDKELAEAVTAPLLGSMVNDPSMLIVLPSKTIVCA